MKFIIIAPGLALPTGARLWRRTSAAEPTIELALSGRNRVAAGRWPACTTEGGHAVKTRECPSHGFPRHSSPQSGWRGL